MVPTGLSGTLTAAYWQGAKSRQIFAQPDTPIGPPPGGPPEMPLMMPGRFATPVKTTELMVGLLVTGRLAVIGPSVVHERV